MKKNHIKTILFFLFFAGVLSPCFAMAIEKTDISVNFEGLPFEAEYWYPGARTNTATITIENEGEEEKEVYFGARKDSGDDILAKALAVYINGESENLLSLFDEPIELGEFNEGESKSYEVYVEFESGHGNQTQDKEIGFSVVVGLWELDEEDEEPDEEGAETTRTAFTATMEEVEFLIVGGENPWRTGSDFASIIWRTTKAADCTFAYGETSREEMGEYSESTQTPRNVIHLAEIAGLSPETEYYYRIACQSSPEEEAITDEYNFTTIGVDEDVIVLPEEGEVLGEIDIEELDEEEVGETFLTEEDCEEAGFYWYDDVCHLLPEAEILGEEDIVEEEPEEEEEEEDKTATWVVLVLASLGLVADLYYLSKLK